MTQSEPVSARWVRELSKHPRRSDGRRELRQFHTAAGSVQRSDAKPNQLSNISTAVLAVGNGAVLGGLLGSLFGVTSGVAAGALLTVMGYLWISGAESSER